MDMVRDRDRDRDMDMVRVRDKVMVMVRVMVRVRVRVRCFVVTGGHKGVLWSRFRVQLDRFFYKRIGSRTRTQERR